MSPPKDLRLVASCPAPAAPGRQNRGLAPRGGRGRGRYAARQAAVVSDCALALPDPRAWKAQFPAIWQRFILARWGRDPHAASRDLGVNLQTARNWIDGLHVPTGDVVARAMLMWRRELLAAAIQVQRAA